jgi:NADH dehydrogenase (ubiquinone) 1 alpha subcomplex subunit 5
MHFTRCLFDIVKKSTTGIKGIPVHPNPRPHLIKTYKDTLTALTRLPATAVYRQAAEALTQQRLAVVESNEDVAEIERTIGAGQIEELIMQAKDELTLVPKMEEWKPWEPLETPVPKGQWDYSSTKD